MKREPLAFTSADYDIFLTNIKQQIKSARIKASLAVNKELVLLYWQIGQSILERQQAQGWGSKVIAQISKDLKLEFPGITGFSTRNLKYMRSFAEGWSDIRIVQEVLAQIPWYHNIALLEKLKGFDRRLWYAQKTVENGWSRNVLVMQIESSLYERQGHVSSNFKESLSDIQSDLARQLLKDSYVLDFCTLPEKAAERDLEKALVTHIRDFLLELGLGFTFAGSQYRLEVGGDDFFLDLLFYHLKLRCFVVIDLKMGPFKPEYSGKMNFYINVVDDLLRHKDDNPTIGIVLCKSKNKAVAEYSLRNTGTPQAITTHSLPASIQSQIPSAEELEREIEKVSVDIDSIDTEL